MGRAGTTEKLADLLGDGIFTVDGEKLLHQRKAARYEIGTKTLETIYGTYEEGTELSNAFDEANAMTLMKFIWGEDAEEFLPERWLDESGTFQQKSSFKITAFQAGPRICVGKDFAYRQMKTFAAVLCHSYKFKLAVQNESVRYKTMLTLHIDGDLHIHASHRFEPM
ncbi:unnamed protein product [Sphenostylis stenocarpa]|uniref:Cytochrome P450 n=1 Tax=Sphenostylis stenocarpa TaxID=92480 RepID=A0AA86SWJ6_9FABA|nr:unnamed protein product [Sphenostylis stenocarpa]